MSDHSIREKWDRRYDRSEGPGEVAWVLAENSHLLAPGTQALDLACGRGASALYLAQMGLQVSAWDISPVAIAQLEQAAASKELKVKARVRDAIARPPAPESFDLILVSHFLDRGLAPALKEALKPAGLLYYQTYSRFQVTGSGPANPDYRLDDNELIHLFSGLKIRVYREEQRLGDTGSGWRDKVMLVAQKDS